MMFLKNGVDIEDIEDSLAERLSDVHSTDIQNITIGIEDIPKQGYIFSGAYPSGFCGVWVHEVPPIVEGSSVTFKMKHLSKYIT